MTKEEFCQKIWPFYLQIERDFLTTLNYIAFCDDNYGTYSIEFERLILSIGSEIDIVCKQICRSFAPDETPNNIISYCAIISQNADIMNANVSCKRLNVEYTPFSGWTVENSPTWWKAYNKIKHDRFEQENYKLGNLENTFHALAGLFALNRCYCKMVSASMYDYEPYPQSQLFSMAGWDVYIPIGNGFYQMISTNGTIGVVHE